MADEQTFQDGETYQLVLTFDPEDGYQLAWGCTITVNSEAYTLYPSDFTDKLMIPFSFAEVIDKVAIPADALPTATIGGSFTDDPIDIPVAEGSHYTVSGYWYYTDEFGEIHKAGTFEAGKAYCFRLEVIPKAGYSLCTNGNLEISAGRDKNWVPATPTYACWDIRTSFAEVITRAELLDLPTAEAGLALQGGIFPVKVPDGVAYTAEACWYIFDSEMNGWYSVETSEETVVVENGKKYRLKVQITPNSGYELSEKLIVAAYGKEQIPSNIDIDRWCICAYDYTFLETITQVVVNGVEEPAIGQAASVDGLTVPEDALYTITMAEWCNSGDYSLAEVFEPGKNYELVITVMPKTGYEFSQNVVVLLDGAPPDLIGANGSELYIYKNVSFEEIIPKIELSNLPEMQVGEISTTDMTVPADAAYIAWAEWHVWNDRKMVYERFDGIFQAGKVYRLFINLVPGNGYRISKDATELYINGIKGNAIVGDDLACYEKVYGTDQKTIRRVELTVEKPVPEKHSSIPPVITAVSGNASLNENCSWITGTLEKRTPFEGFFSAEGSYGINATVLAEEGYLFAEDLTVVVNGIVLPASAIRNRGKEVFVTYFFGMKVPAVSGGAAPEKSESSDADTTEQAAPSVKLPVQQKYTVPISGEEKTVRVEAQVKGTTASIDKVDDEMLHSVIGSHVETGTVTIDFSGLNKNIDTVVLHTETIRQIAEAAHDEDNDTEALEIKMSDGTSIEFCADSLAEKVEQAQGKDITISIQPSHKVKTLTTEQKREIGLRPAYDVTVMSDGKYISDLGGEIIIHAPYTLKQGEKAEGLVVYYVDDEGNREACETNYDSEKKWVNWKTDHLSLYMIAYEEPTEAVAEAEAPVAEVPAADTPIKGEPSSASALPVELPVSDNSQCLLYVSIGCMTMAAALGIFLLLFLRKTGKYQR